MAGGNPATGSLSVIGMAPEATPGTYVAPTRWVYPETCGITAKPDVIKKMVMSGARAAARTNVPTKFKIGGPIALPLFTDHGIGFAKPTYGAVAGLTALTADTVKALTPVTTTSGLSTITLTNTGAVTYVLGAWVQVNTGASSEVRQIAGITGNGAAGTILTVGALVTNAAAAAGTAVQQVAQLQYTTATSSKTLPTCSIELDEGNSYSWQLAGVFVNDFAFKAAKDEVQATYTVFGTKLPVKIATPTTPAPSAGELADLKTPFTSVNTQFVAYQDPAQSGGATATSTQQMATYIDSVDITWKNTLIEKPFHDQSQVYRAFPGVQDLSVKYQYTNQSGRLAEFEDYLSSQKNSTVPFFAGAALDQSGVGTGWRAYGMYVPAMNIIDVAPARTTGDVITATVDAVGSLTTAQGDLCQAFVISSLAGSVTGL